MTAASSRVRFLLAWHAAALVLVTLLPTLVRLGAPFWELPERLLMQTPALVAGYLGAALAVTLVHESVRTDRWWLAPLPAVLPFAAAWLLLLHLPAYDHSRLVFAGGALLGAVLAVAPTMLRGRAEARALVCLALAAAVTVGWAGQRSTGAVTARGSVPGDGDRTTARASALHNLTITRHPGLVEHSHASGGGLAAWRDGYVAVTGTGTFAFIRWNASALVAEPIDAPPLLERDAFIAATSEVFEDRQFRVMDLLVDTSAAPPRLLVSHYHWDPAERCVAMRISAISVDALLDGVPGATWATLFTTRPCIPVAETHAIRGLTNHGGGLMGPAPGGGLLFTVGDFLRDGRRHPERFPETLDNDYGKILHLDLEGGSARPFSIGHRNPQGLLVTGDGTIWSTEHGPHGGDELNRIVEGAHFGWPAVTYGLHPGEVWRPDDGDQVHEPFEEPAYAWLPSVGISNLIMARGDGFPAWAGDLLVGSLTGRSLFRVRLRQGRVVYAERIPIDVRIRDLVEDAEGRILIWADYLGPVSLANAGDERTGEMLFSSCAVCHEARPGSPATAPDLRGVVGRPSAADPGFEYSEALRALDITWTARMLDRFLQDPSRVAPGTTMVAEGLGEPERRSVIAFLRTYR